MGDAISERLADENLLVRCAAVKLLSEGALRACPEAISLLLDCLDCLDDQPTEVRHAVVLATASIPAEYKCRIAKALKPRLNDVEVIRVAARRLIHGRLFSLSRWQREV